MKHFDKQLSKIKIFNGKKTFTLVSIIQYSIFLVTI